MAEARMIEMMARAIATATDEVDDHIGIFDYTNIGKKPGAGAHLVIDNRNSKVLAEGKDNEEAHKLYNEFRDRYLARAALSVLAAKVSDEMVEAAKNAFGFRDISRPAALMRDEDVRAIISAALSAAGDEDRRA